MSPSPTPLHRSPSLDLDWLVRLRWGAILGQLCLLLLAQWALDAQLPLALLLGIVSVELLSNILLSRVVDPNQRPPTNLTMLVLAFDMVLLTALLGLSGGSSNPFSFLYLVHIAVAAVVLPQRWTWALWALAAACTGALFFFDDVSGSTPLTNVRTTHNMRVHLRGMWVAFLVAATFIVYFVQRIRGLLAQRDQQLALARKRSANNQRLASLATLAAGAAHELSTPLSTIAVVAADLDDSRNTQQELQEDAELIRREVERCRRILSRLSADAGSPHGETPQTLTVAALVERTLSDAPWQKQLNIEWDDNSRKQSLHVPVQALGSALRSLIDNAYDALGDASCSAAASADSNIANDNVTLRIAVRDSSCLLAVHDRGSGMPPHVIEHALDPFFTTKATGRGMGLGLFLARAVAEQLGGDLQLQSQSGHGTIATLRIPLSPGA